MMHQELGHSQSAHRHGPTPERALWVAVVLNGAFLALEAVAGWWTNSLALLSDAGHMVSDVGALAIALIALRISTRQPSANYTFGLRRAPVLGGLLNAATLVVVVILIASEAVERFQHPPVLDAGLVFMTGIAGLLVNLGSAWYLARSQDQSVNTRGAMLHLLSDALGSIAAIASAVAVWGWEYYLADPIVSVVIAVLILVGSWPLLRDTVRILLQRAPVGVDVDSVRTMLRSVADVDAIEDLHVWALDSGQPVLTAVLRVSCSSTATASQLADGIRTALQQTYGIQHATIECRDSRTAGEIPVCPGLRTAEQRR